jgi:hypothetical protein
MAYEDMFATITDTSNNGIEREVFYGTQYHPTVVR